jgi:hypothetical protein
VKKGNPHTLVGKGFDVHPENINRKGYPVGKKNRSTLLRYWSDVKTKRVNPLTKEEIEATIEDFIVLAHLDKGMEGDVSAIREVYDTLYGKIKEKLDIDLDHKVSINPKEWIK